MEITHLPALNATLNGIALMRAAIDVIAEKRLEPCPCQTALDLAIWSNREKLTESLRQHYGPLLARYLSK